MRVEIKEGGDGHRCWNADAVAAYAAGIDEREARIAAANPDVEIVPGLVRCYGCEVQEYHYGTKCTAMLTRTLYAVRDETPPREADAAGSLAEIDGLLTMEPGSVGLGSHNGPLAPVAAAGAPSDSEPRSDPERRVAQEPPDREPRRRGLFRR